MEEKKINEDLDLLDDDLLDDDGGISSIKENLIQKEPLSLKTKLLIGIGLFLIVIFLIVISIYTFLNLTLKKNLNDIEKFYLSSVKNYIINPLIGATNTLNLNYNSPTTSAVQLKTYLNSSSNLFYKKLDLKSELLTSITQLINKEESKYKKYQNLIIKYKYFPQELSTLVKDIKVLPILISLNSIKIYIADYTFIKTDLFNQYIGNYVFQRSNFISLYPSIPQDYLRKIVKQDLLYFKDKGVSLYLQDILFNYMYSDNGLASVKFIQDFKNVFNSYLAKRYNDLKAKGYISTSYDQFVADYISFIGKFYQRTYQLYGDETTSKDLPVDVLLVYYDPKTQTLAFNVNIQLSPSLLSKIQVYQLANSIITLLRESRLIIGKDIKVNSLKVNTVTRRIGGIKVVYKTTKLSFKTKVQSKVNVEVTDSSF